jgi:hypothetical protein
MARFDSVQSAAANLQRYLRMEGEEARIEIVRAQIQLINERFARLEDKNAN